MSLFGVQDAVQLISNILDKAIPDPMQKAQAEALIEQVRQQPDLIQAQINANEALSPNLFVSGWRPAIGWVCAISLLFAFLIAPCLAWFHISYPVIPLDQIQHLVLALLGLGGLRTYEKVKGVS